MISSVWMFLLMDAVFLGAFLFLLAAAFRVRVLYGFLVLLPFGALAFVIKYPKEGGTRFAVCVAAYTALNFIVGSSPELKTPLGRFFPASRLIADALGTKDSPVLARGSGSNGSPPAPREAHDLAETGTSSALHVVGPIPATVDPFAAQRAACAQHAADLNAQYAELTKARAKLKKGSPQVAAFNAKAAKYQEGLRALAAEQAQLAALDHPAANAASAQAAPASGDPKEAEANAALTRLRALAAEGDYASFADTLKKCLADYQHTAAFPQIAVTARGTLANATPDKLAAAIQAQGAAARTEMDAAMGRVRGIVNQTPPTVPKPPPNAESYHYGFHPGALTPDFAHADLYSTRELWKGDFVNMDAAPGVFYRSADCEFNPQTKFFYTNRDVPKKRLTNAEIVEVVRLYRAIAADQLVLNALPQRLLDAQGASADLLSLNRQLAARR